MIRLMTREFAKWADKHGMLISELAAVLDEVEAGKFEANLGGRAQETGSVSRARQTWKWPNRHLLQE
jgi:hypothetical protein